MAMFLKGIGAMYAIQEWRPRFNLSSENPRDHRCGLIARVEGQAIKSGSEYLVDSNTTRPEFATLASALALNDHRLVMTLFFWRLPRETVILKSLNKSRHKIGWKRWAENAVSGRRRHHDHGMVGERVELVGSSAIGTCEVVRW